MPSPRCIDNSTNPTASHEADEKSSDDLDLNLDDIVECETDDEVIAYLEADLRSMERGRPDKTPGGPVPEPAPPEPEIEPTVAFGTRAWFAKTHREHLASISLEEDAPPPKPSPVDLLKAREAEGAAKRLAKKQAKSAERSRRYRARRKAATPAPAPKITHTRWADRRLAALLKATSNAKGNKRLEQLGKRVNEIVEYLQLRRAFGKRGATHAEVAAHLGRSKKAIERLARIVRELEQPGQCWHGME